MKYLFLFLFLISGCATTSQNQNSNPNLPKTQSESSIIVCRQAGGHLALRGLDLFIDDKEIKTLSAGSTMEVIVPPGVRKVVFKFPWDTGIKNLQLTPTVLDKSTKIILIGSNLDSFYMQSKGTGFTTTWRAAEIQKLPDECQESIRQILR
jgi:hypothetical protein